MKMAVTKKGLENRKQNRRRRGGRDKCHCKNQKILEEEGWSNSQSDECMQSRHLIMADFPKALREIIREFQWKWWLCLGRILHVWCTFWSVGVSLFCLLVTWTFNRTIRKWESDGRSGARKHKVDDSEDVQGFRIWRILVFWSSDFWNLFLRKLLFRMKN